MNYLQLRRSSRWALTLLLASAALPSAPAAEYTVRRGDTLSDIARQHRIPLAKLQRANPHLKGGNIAQGQQLSLPAKSPGAAPKPKAPPSAANLAAASKPPSPSKRPAAPTPPKKPLPRPSAPHPERDTTIDLTPPARPTQAKKSTQVMEKSRPRPSGASLAPPPARDAYYQVVKNSAPPSSRARAADPKRSTPRLATRATPDPAAAPGPKTLAPSSTPLPNPKADSPPAETAPPEDTQPPEAVSPSSEVAYLVAENDNLESIAREFRTNPNTLRHLNQLGTFDSPAPGSVITVPWKTDSPLH